MNLKPGGRGGFTSEEARKGGKVSGLIHANKLKNNFEYSKRHRERSSEKMKERFKNGTVKPIQENYSWKDKKHSEETKLKQSLIKRGTGLGIENSQFGTMWITNGIENKKVKKDVLIPNGWYKGRKNKML